MVDCVNRRFHLATVAYITCLRGADGSLEFGLSTICPPWPPLFQRRVEAVRERTEPAQPVARLPVDAASSDVDMDEDALDLTE